MCCTFSNLYLLKSTSNSLGAISPLLGGAFSLPVFREEPVHRCFRGGLEPSLRRRGEALVHVYAGAAPRVVGVLQGLPKHPRLARALGWSSASPPVVPRPATGGVERTRVEGSRLEPRASSAGAPFDVVASNRQYAAERRRRLGVAGVS